MVLASGGSIKKKLHWTIGVEFWAPEFQTARTKFAVENHGAQNSDRWTTHKLCILSSELHSFFPDRNSQWKAPQFHAMRTPSCRKTDQLRLSSRKTSSKLKSWKLSLNRKIPPELNLWNAVSPGVLHQRCAKWRLLLFCPAKNYGARNLDWKCVLKWQISGSELKKSSTGPSVSNSELQGFGKNEILGVPLKRIAKYEVFWKWPNFKHFLGSQLEAPQFLRDTRKKDSVFCIFAISQSRAPRNLDKKWQFRIEAPGFWTGGNGKMVKMLDQKVWELST